MIENKADYDLVTRLLRAVLNTEDAIKRMEKEWDSYFVPVASKHQQDIMKEIRAEHYELRNQDYADL